MSKAAYDRGSQAIRNQVDQHSRAVEFSMMDDYNALPKYPGAPTPFSDVVISTWRGGHWLADPEDDFGFWYRTLADAVRSWDIDLTGYDASKQTWTATPRPRNW